MRKTANVFIRIQAKLDVGTVLGSPAGGEELQQLYPVLQQGITVAAKKLPVAIGPVDGNGAKRRGKLHHGLYVHQRLLWAKPIVGPGIGTGVALLTQTGVQVFKIPIKGDRGVAFDLRCEHGVLWGYGNA